MRLSPQEMETAIVKNLLVKTGKSLNDWFKVLSEENITDKKKMQSCLKEKHKVEHFQAQTVVKLFLAQ